MQKFASATPELIVGNSGDYLSTSTTTTNGFLDKVKGVLWPIKAHEIPKVVSMMVLMFCILFIQNLIRALKDTMVNTQIGPETISFLKFWGVLPASFLMTLVYVKLVTMYRGTKIFYGIVGSFIAFFFIFGFLIFPNHTTYHISQETTSSLVGAHPHFKWFILLGSNWAFSLFYVIAELWPTTVFALLFWQFVNSISTVEESKRFYIIFGLFGQTGLFFSGQFLSNAANMVQFLDSSITLGSADFEIALVQVIMGTTVFCGTIALGLFWYLNNRIIDTEKVQNVQFRAQKKHASLLESLKFIMQSRYIALIAVMLICYGATINLIEGPWKAKATKLYPNMTEYTAFVGKYLSYSGVAVIIFVVIGSNVIRRLGWLTAALMTPIAMLITGGVFFSVANFESVADFMAGIFLMSDPLVLAVSVGIVQNVFAKSTKYTVFDSTKEMAYVPLDHETKTKGKAAADLISSKLGKSTASLLQSLVFMILPASNYQSISMGLMVMFVGLCLIWIICVYALNKEYTNIAQDV